MTVSKMEWRNILKHVLCEIVEQGKAQGTDNKDTYSSTFLEKHISNVHYPLHNPTFPLPIFATYLRIEMGVYIIDTLAALS